MTVTSDAAWEAAVRVGMAPSFTARRAPDRPAVIAPSGDRTASELNGNANRLARALRRRGLDAGDPVALVCGNRAEFVEAWAACTRAGFRLTPVNWHLTADEATYIVEDCGARALIVDGDLGLSVSSSRAEHHITVGTPIDGYEAWAGVLGAEDPSDIDDPVLGTSMLYTSGTTGYPKGVHKPPNPNGAVTGVAAYFYGDDHVHLCTGPLYHAAPYFISMAFPVFCGVPVVLMPRWDAEDCLRLVERHRVSHTHVVPTMFHRLLALPDDVRSRYDVSSLLAIVHGAAPCPVSVKRAIIEWLGPIVYEYYSSTEGAGTVVDDATWLRKPGTVGRPAAGSLYVGDADGNPSAAGSEGLVWLKASDTERFRYFGDEAKTEQAYRGDFFTLGDIGHVDDDGFLFLTDRSANLIISGGVNIYPAEIDAVLLQHPAVGDAGVIGVPDEEWGELVVAVVELEPGASVAPAELMAFCRERLAAFKCPRRVEFVDHLPRDDNGKLYKRRLRDTYR